MRTFCAAVSAVNGGSGGRFIFSSCMSVPKRIALGHRQGVSARDSATREIMRASRVSLHGRKRGWRQQLAADVLDELAILLRLGDHRDPFGIGEKSAPALLALGHAVPGEHVGDLLAALADQRGSSSVGKLQQRRSTMKVKDAMHKGVDWVSPDIPVTELAKLMCEHDTGAIPIGENDRLIGMVTDCDIVCKGLAQDSFDARLATARDVMTPGIHCCRDDDDLAKVVRHMERLQVRRLPVINKSRRMVGILSLGDVSNSAPGDLLSECVKSVSAHH